MSLAKKSLTELAQMVNEGMRRQPVEREIAPSAEPSMPLWFAITPESPAERPLSRFAIKTARGVKWLH